jgi:hypothetical protein
MVIIPQNTDLALIITLTDINNNPLNLKLLSGLGIWLTYSNDIPFLKYGLNNIAVDDTNLSEEGFIPIKIVNAVLGQVKIIVEAKNTVNASLGVLDMHIKVQYTSKDTTTGQWHNTSEPLKSWGKIVNSVSSGTTNL